LIGDGRHFSSSKTKKTLAFLQTRMVDEVRGREWRVGETKKMGEINKGVGASSFFF
jgi:hypothetical protein